MKEKNLFKIALLCVLIGLPLLFYFSEKIEVEEKHIARISAGDVDRGVKVSGTVSKIVDRGTVTVLEITQPTRIDVVLFMGNLSIERGEEVDVYGKVDEYEGEYQIIGEIVRRKKG